MPILITCECCSFAEGSKVEKKSLWRNFVARLYAGLNVSDSRQRNVVSGEWANAR